MSDKEVKSIEEVKGMNKPKLKRKDKKEMLKIIDDILEAFDKSRWNIAFSREDLRNTVMDQIIYAVIFGYNKNKTSLEIIKKL